MTATNKKRNILIAHLDLGIGGAEQLVVHVSKLLLDSGHNIRILTTHHDINHCFEDTKPDGVLGPFIEVYGDWMPRKFLGRFHALFAILRMLYLACIIVLFYRSNTDIVFLDGVSAPLFILKKFGGMKVLFYCHFPDLLLCTDRINPIKKFYRYAVDGIEEYTTGLSDMILVNSKFTGSIVKDTFPRIVAREKPQILYPAIKGLSKDQIMAVEEARRLLPYCNGYDNVFVSLNRYERKKRVDIAISAIDVYRKESTASKKGKKAILIVAGGYDTRVTENVEYLVELQALCKSTSLSYTYLPDLPTSPSQEVSSPAPDVIFRTSISSIERTALFTIATALLYTPDREHFGIVPLEAMQTGLPVIAVNSGGPTETIKHGETGYLSQQSGEDFAKYMDLLTTDDKNYVRMKSAAMQWVSSNFSESQMKENLNSYVEKVCRR